MSHHTLHATPIHHHKVSVTASSPTPSRSKQYDMTQSPVPAFQHYSGRDGPISPAAPPNMAQTRKKQKEKTETARSVLQGMSWRFLTETVLDDREYVPPPVLTKEGYEYVQKLERERQQQQSQTQQSEQQFHTPPKPLPISPDASPQLQKLFSDLVHPAPVHSAYFSPPIAPATVREKLGLFDSSPSNKYAAAQQQQIQARSTPSRGQNKSPVKMFHADTPVKRAQAAAQSNAKRQLMQSIHPIDPNLVRHNSRKELPPLPPKPTPADLNITTETQVRVDGLMERSREEDVTREMDQSYETLEQRIVDMTTESIKESQSQELPAPHPTLDRTPRKREKKSRSGGALAGKRGIRFAGQQEEKEEGSGSSDESTDPELDDDAPARLSRVERARKYHAQLLASLTDPFADEKRLKRELGVAPKHSRHTSSLDLSSTHFNPNTTALHQVVMWKESSRLKEASDIPEGIKHVLLAEPTTEDRLRFIQRLNKAQEEEARLLQEARVAEEEEDREREQNQSQLRIAINGEEDESTAIAATDAQERMRMAINGGGGDDEDGEFSLDQVSDLPPSSPPPQPQTRFRTASIDLAGNSPLSPTLSSPLPPDAFFNLPSPVHYIHQLDEDAHANPFHQVLPKAKFVDTDDSIEHAVEMKARSSAQEEFARLQQQQAGSSPSSNSTLSFPGSSPKVSAISLAPNSPMLSALDADEVYNPTPIDPNTYADPSERFRKEHIKVETQVANIVDKKVAFEYQSTQASKLAAIAKARKEKELSERSDALLNDDPITGPAGMAAIRTIQIGRQLQRKAKETVQVTGVPSFAFSPVLNEGSAVHPLASSASKDLLDFAALGREAAMEASLKSRKKAEILARKQALSPSPTNPQPVFKPAKATPLPYSIATGSSFLESRLPDRPAKQLNTGWYLPRKEWKVELKGKSNDDLQAEEEESERLSQLRKDESTDAATGLPKILHEKQQALDEAIPTLFIASVYKGHLEKISRAQKAQKEKELREEKAAQLAQGFWIKPGGASGARVHFKRPSTTPTAPVQTPLSPGGTNFAPFSPPPDPLANVPVRMPGYLTELIPLDPSNPETVIVDFAPGTNKVLKPTLDGHGDGRKSGANSPTKKLFGVGPSSSVDMRPGSSMDDDRHRPMSPPNPNVQAHRAAVLASSQGMYDGSPSKSGGLPTTPAGAQKKSLLSPTASFLASQQARVAGSPSSKSPSAKSPSGKSGPLPTHHVGHHSISDMIVAHQSASVASMVVPTAEEVEEAALLSPSALTTPQQGRSRRGSFTSPPGTAAPGAAGARSRSRTGGASGATLALPGQANLGSPTSSLGGSRDTRRKSWMEQPHMRSLLAAMSPTAASGGASKCHHGKHASVTMTDKPKEVIPGLAHSHHAHAFLPNITPTSDGLRSGGGGGTKDRGTSNVSMRAYIMAQAQAELAEARAMEGDAGSDARAGAELEADDQEFHHPLEVGLKRPDVTLIRRVSTLTQSGPTFANGIIPMSRQGESPVPNGSYEDDLDEEDDFVAPIGVKRTIVTDNEVIYNPSTMVQMDPDELVDAPVQTNISAATPIYKQGKGKGFFNDEQLTQPAQFE